MSELEDYIPTINEKVGPLVKRYEAEVKQAVEKLDDSLYNKELEAGLYLEAHKKVFFEHLEKLCDEIKSIMFEEIKGGQLKKPGFEKIKAYIEMKLTPLKTVFRQHYKRIAKELMGESIVEALLKAYDGQLAKFLMRLFMTYGQELDDF